MCILNFAAKVSILVQLKNYLKKNITLAEKTCRLGHDPRARVSLVQSAYIDVSSTNLSFENHCVSNSPSKIEGAGGSMKLSRKEIILLSRFATAPLS